MKKGFVFSQLITLFKCVLFFSDDQLEDSDSEEHSRLESGAGEFSLVQEFFSFLFYAF